MALAIALMLNALGASVAATTIDGTGHDSPSASSFGIGAAIWLLVSNLIGLGVGGYVAARLSGTSDNTDGTLMAWQCGAPPSSFRLRCSVTWYQGLHVCPLEVLQAD